MLVQVRMSPDTTDPLAVLATSFTLHVAVPTVLIAL